jgi:hypothetical protein
MMTEYSVFTCVTTKVKAIYVATEAEVSQAKVEPNL